MDSEEWKFLLDFTQNQEEAAKNGANAIVSERDDIIGIKIFSRELII